MDEQGEQGYDVDKKRDGIGDYRLRDYNGLEGFEANDFPRGGTRRDGGGAKGRRTEEGRTVVKGDRKGGVVVIGSKKDTY